MSFRDGHVIFGVVTRGFPLLGKSTTDPVAANLLTVFLTVCLCIDCLRAVSLHFNPASTTSSILFNHKRESNGTLKLQMDTDSEKNCQYLEPNKQYTVNTAHY